MRPGATFGAATIRPALCRHWGPVMPNPAVDAIAAQYAVSKAMGKRSISSDSVFVPDNFEYLSVLIKAFPWPVLTPSGEVEIWHPGGYRTFQPANLEIGMQGQVVLMETQAGHAYEALTVLSALQIDGTIYEGNPLRFARAMRVRDLFFKVDPAERDAENRQQATQYNGTIFYTFLGEVLPGNAANAGAIALAAAGGALSGV